MKSSIVIYNGKVPEPLYTKYIHILIFRVLSTKSHFPIVIFNDVKQRFGTMPSSML